MTVRRFHLFARLDSTTTSLETKLIEWNHELHNKLINGDKSVITYLYQQLSPPLYTAIYNVVRNKETAEDILHDAFIHLLEKVHLLQDVKKIQPWAKKIAFHQALEYIRRKSLFQRITEQFLKPELQYVQDNSVENQNLVIQLLSQLSAENRLILWLYIVEKYTHDEIAELYGKSPSYSKSVVHRALNKVRKSEEFIAMEQEKCI